MPLWELLILISQRGETIRSRTETDIYTDKHRYVRSKEGCVLRGDAWYHNYIWITAYALASMLDGSNR